MNKYIEDSAFWKILSEFESTTNSIKMENICEKFSVNEDEIFDIVSYLDSFDYKVKVSDKKGVRYLIPPEEKINIQFNFSFVEWLAMQSHFPKMSELADMPFHDLLANKLGEVESIYPKLDIFNNQYQDSAGAISIIKTALNEKNTLNFTLSKNINIDIYPHQLVFIDGQLSVVGEEKNDRCLIYFEINTIIDVKSNESSNYIPNFGSVEVNDFVMAIRSVEGAEVRLILKVNSMAENLDLKPEYHLLGNPYITCNMEGDFIWAATVEVSNELFEWLHSIDSFIEILDPEKLKSEYEEYIGNNKVFSIAS